nr:MAG TPA: hypothetical protein [Caudoviricetes sp.]
MRKFKKKGDYMNKRKKPFLDRHPKTALYISIITLLIQLIVFSLILIVNN